MTTHRTPVAPVTMLLTSLAVRGALLVGCGADHPDGAGAGSPSPTSASSPVSRPIPDGGAELFGPAPAAAESEPPDTSLGTPVRARYVSFDAAVLPQSATGQRLTLRFFEDAVFTARIETIDKQQLLTSWTGPVVGLDHSVVVITLAAGRYQVTASTTRGTFTMSMTRAGFYQVEEVGQPLPIDSGAASLSATATS